ncbi:MAG: 6-pyruvoyl-tetrahydropterin synthase-related protein [Clostridia bacterium]|nr:6-pyruvoyl-tetrahydropterin synthase-related protein [Clostridia bacterium]
MFNRKYRFKFYLNARHAVKLDESDPKVHPHTWEIVLYISKKREGFIQFSRTEKDIQIYLSKYEGKLLNEIAPFDKVVPTMENIGEIFCVQIIEMLKDGEWELNRLEISENPTRTYIISDIKEACKNIDCTSSAELEIPKPDEVQPKLYNGGSGEGTEANQLGQAVEETGEEYNAKMEVAAAIEANANTHVVKEESVVKEKKLKNFHYMLIGVGILILAAVITVFWITRSGMYPWGSDSWYHVFKADMLYKGILDGNFFPLYTSEWYNGIQPLRYWAPLPHYIIAVLEMLSSGNIAIAYNIFIALIVIGGGMGWILWGKKTGRVKLALILAPLWFFLPDNLRVLFSEGNISRVVVTSVFPYLLLAVWSYMESRNKRTLILISLSMTAITLCHAMISAMVGITVFIYVLIYSIAEKKPRQGIEAVAAVLLGIAMAGVWLYPALKGGITSMDQSAVSELMQGLTYPFTQSLNPLIRFQSADNFYFGISVFIAAAVGLWLGDKKSKIGFGVALLIFLGTTRELMPILVKIPMSQLFWMMRFTPLAMGAFFCGLLLWKKLRKEVLAVILVAIAIDSAVSFAALAHNSPMPEGVKEVLDAAAGTAVQRIALLDLSEAGSFPSFYISNNQSGKKVSQVFGSGWQGAHTTKNIMWMNTALEKGWYSYLLDRCLEHGADTIVVKKDKVKNYTEFMQRATTAGYKEEARIGEYAIYKFPVKQRFATKVEYKALAIGRYASNIAYMFPEFEVGEDVYLDNYSESKLLDYKVIYLSGFKYKDKTKAEELVKELSHRGVKFVIDLAGAESDIYSSRASFLEVMAQPVDFNGKFPMLELGSDRIELGGMPKDIPLWRTVYLENLDGIYGKVEFQRQEMDFMGTKVNDNIVFLGFNLPYFTMETGDTQALKVLEKAIGFKSHSTPVRKIVNIELLENKNTIQVRAKEEGVNIGIASLDTFQALDGEYGESHNLIVMKGKELKIKTRYPHLITGVAVSILGLLGMLVLYSIVNGRKPWRVRSIVLPRVRIGENV